MKSIKYIIKMWMIGTVSLSVMVLSTTPVIGQNTLETFAGVDIVSKYVWRGVDQGMGASFQPALGLAYKGFSLGAWGSAPFTNVGLYEFDLAVEYSVGGFSIGITDYYWKGSDESFFNYYADNHLFEGNLAFSFGEKFPLTLSWNTFFAGDDRDENGKQQFSTYIEAAYDFSLGGLDFTASAGAAPWSSPAWLTPADGKSGFRISAIAIQATKTIEFTPTFSAPLFVQCIFSPATEASHLVVGFSF